MIDSLTIIQIIEVYWDKKRWLLLPKVQLKELLKVEI